MKPISKPRAYIEFWFYYVPRELWRNMKRSKKEQRAWQQSVAKVIRLSGGTPPPQWERKEHDANP